MCDCEGCTEFTITEVRTIKEMVRRANRDKSISFQKPELIRLR